MSKSAGFGAVGVAVIVAAVALLGLVGWRIYDANKSKQDSSMSQSGDMQDQQSNDAKQSQQPEKTQPIDPNEGYVVIREWGVRFKPVDGLDDVEYFKPADIDAEAVTFTTKALANAASGCSSSSGDMVMGLLTRSTEAVPGNGGVVATIDGYAYQYRAPQATCGAGDLENNIVPQISQSLKSLEAIK